MAVTNLAEFILGAANASRAKVAAEQQKRHAAEVARLAALPLSPAESAKRRAAWRADHSRRCNVCPAELRTPKTGDPATHEKHRLAFVNAVAGKRLAGRTSDPAELMPMPPRNNEENLLPLPGESEFDRELGRLRKEWADGSDERDAFTGRRLDNVRQSAARLAFCADISGRGDTGGRIRAAIRQLDAEAEKHGPASTEVTEAMRRVREAMFRGTSEELMAAGRPSPGGVGVPTGKL